MIPWLQWQIAMLPPWGKLVLLVVVFSLVLQVVDLAVRSWRVLLVGAVVVFLLGLLPGCESAAFDASPADAAAVDLAPVIDGGIDAEPVARVFCSPSPITLDYDCGGGTPSGRPCWKAPALDKAPCEFFSYWLVADCSQCWVLP